jgi:tRNA U34 5-methylaminomethyl-2-thiouridine-forming methyltransferase MnmC
MPTGDGCPTLVHPGHGEPCHDTRGAWAEALQLHVAGCDLPRRLLRGERVRLLDLGTAPGWNLAAAWSVAARLPGHLVVTGVERSEEALSAAAELAAEEGWKAGAPEVAVRAFEEVHGALERARRAGRGGEWFELGERFRLRLLRADAASALAELDPAERFDAVFLDLFSPRVEPEAWETGFLGALAGRVAKGGRLTTYTLSHPVRAALMARGLAVGWAGARSGRRGGTWASRGGWVPPLSERLRARLERRSGRLAAAQGWAMAVG